MKLFLLFVSLTQIKWRWKHCKNVLNCLNVKLKPFDMRLRRLTGLERDKIENEYNELLSYIAELEDLSK